MTESYIKTSDLRPGIIISEDIFVNTSYPIFRKDTKILVEHLEILCAFGVEKVAVKKNAVVKREEITKIVEEGTVKLDDSLTINPIKEVDFQEKFIEVVRIYKKEFLAWRAGVRPDIAKIRSITMPLLETFIEGKGMPIIPNDFPDVKDYTYYHPIAVGVLAASISKQMGFPRGEILQLGLAGVFADCGMAKIDRAIIEKTASLSKKEFDEVKKHAIYSYQMVEATPLLREEMKLAIFQHHERLDGSGYPRGNKMEQVSIYSQILAVADVFHAMISERVYQSKESPFKVIEMIKEEGFGKFDIKVVQALQNLVGNLSIGTKVKLTNGDVGEVIFVHRDAILRPMVKKSTDGTITDLTLNRHLAIDKVLL